jgi:hypothetical protein
MTKTFDDMFGWRFEVGATSAGVYQIIARDPNGHLRFSAGGTDPDALIRDGRQWVLRHGSDSN